MTTFKVSQKVWQAEGQYFGSEIDNLSEWRETREAALEDADYFFRFLTEDEQSRVRALYVRAYEVTSVDEDGQIDSATSLPESQYVIGG